MTALQTIGAMTKKTLYLLRCEGEKLYVGVTNQPVETRFLEHLDPGKGTQWTRLYAPIEIVWSRPCETWHDEENTTLDLMLEHGIENVRGGTFCQAKLSQYQITYIRQRAASMQNTCYNCFREGHLAKACTKKQRNQGSLNAKHARNSQKKTERLERPTRPAPMMIPESPASSDAPTSNGPREKNDCKEKVSLDGSDGKESVSLQTNEGKGQACHLLLVGGDDEDFQKAVGASLLSFRGEQMARKMSVDK